MAIQYQTACIPVTHRIEYRTRDAHRGFPTRTVDVLATQDEITDFVRDGYLVREGLLPMAEVERLRRALDEVMAVDDQLETGGGKSFGGVFLRHLMDKHPAFLDFLKFEPTLSVARALLGPAVQVRGFTARLCSADMPGQQTEWHFHQRVIPDPPPPLLARPQTLDVLIYLDSTDHPNGPLQVVPGSHNWTDRDLSAAEFGDLPGQITIPLAAGSCVLTHGSLWHRALPTEVGSTDRRLLLFGYGAAWHKQAIYGAKPADALTARLLGSASCDEETRELLGASGWM